MIPEPITAATLQPFRHGFFGRQGGCSEGDYRSLNCGLFSQDDADRVNTNRRRVANRLAVASQNLITCRQTHSAHVATIRDQHSGTGIVADGLVTTVPGTAIGVLSADCQPVLFIEPNAHVVAAAHAGWRGALAGILENTISAMVTVGAERHQIRAVIGPAISQKKYQIGPEFEKLFMAHDSTNRHFFADLEDGTRVFNLPAYGLMRLERAGIESARWTGHCTYSDPTRHFSYRRSQHGQRQATGLQLSAIVA